MTEIVPFTTLTPEPEPEPQAEPFVVKVLALPSQINDALEALYPRADKALSLEYNPYEKVWVVRLACSRYGIVATLVRLHRRGAISEFTII